jgi:hypothetical protein
VSAVWHSWALGLFTKGWVIRLMIIKDKFWLSLISAHFPCIELLVYEDCEKYIGLGLEVDAWFNVIDPP